MPNYRITLSLLVLAAFVQGPMATRGQVGGSKSKANKATLEPSGSQSKSGKGRSVPPKVGDTATDFELLTVEGKKISLRKLTNSSRVVLLVLRGWPGYQCPICSRQVGEFLAKRKEFAERNVQVVMIYPGPAELLNEHAKEFQGERLFGEGYHYLLDPDYEFTKAWGLRWDAPRETAYPSTFVIDQDSKIAFSKVSKTHGGRTSASTILKELDR